ncbi:MAG: hypothetical protein U9N86_09300 [Bacteroidota bacterium]|nr:hypothetical protein [Bacteroidota bacterium]
MSELSVAKNEISEYNDRSSLKFQIDSEILGSIYLITSDSDSLFVDDLLDSPKLVLRFSNQFCPPCIDDALKFLNDIGQSIGYDNIIVISDFKSSNLLKLFAESHQIKSPIYRFPGSFSFSIDKKEGSDKVPFYMILDSDLRVVLPYYANESDELISGYRNKVLSYFTSIL